MTLLINNPSTILGLGRGVGPVLIYLRQGGEGEAATAAVLSCAGDCSAAVHPCTTLLHSLQF